MYLHKGDKSPGAKKYLWRKSHMRKMNKIVALSLVLAMALSMMASAASFKDQATINAELIDEINLLVNLGVYSEQGTGAGYFEPNATITRAQAAKIIYVLKNKGVDNGATSWTGLDIFTDVEAGAWYEGYVNYCASTGIIAGVGDNKFNPNAELTGVQLAKMLLVVIGYKADVEGYTGDKWDANILADAEAAGFFVDYELSVKGIVSREWAAKMIVNAIRATKVRYEDGSLVEMYNGNNPVTYEKQDLGLLTITGVLVETPNIKLVDNQGDETPANNSNGKNKDSVVWVGVDEDDVNVYEEFEYAADPALLGSFVDVLVKSGS
ncbi:MAG: S-layer homology domain-containing protein, partial [Ruminococcaceae bacterium]|nr:S-layer homology domain-containing protein [Oscillospiraceae bacterium]